jgi:hypothetical protein
MPLEDLEQDKDPILNIFIERMQYVSTKVFLVHDYIDVFHHL